MSNKIVSRKIVCKLIELAEKEQGQIRALIEIRKIIQSSFRDIYLINYSNSTDNIEIENEVLESSLNRCHEAIMFIGCMLEDVLKIKFILHDIDNNEISR